MPRRHQLTDHRAAWTLQLQGGEKEYYLATAAEEIYVAPTAQFSLRGFKVAGAQQPCLYGVQPSR